MRAVMRSFQYAFLECLALFPFLLWINSLLLNNYFQGLSWGYIPLVYLVTAFIGRTIKRNSFKIAISLSISLSIVFLIPISDLWPQMVIIVLFFVLAMRGFHYGQEQVQGILPIGLIWAISLPAYFISYFLYRGAAYADQQQMLTILALILLFFLLFLTNQEHLSKASLSKTNVKKMNKKVKYQNYLYVFLFFVFLLLITEFNPIAAGLLFLFRSVFQFLGSVTPENEMQPEPELDNLGLEDFGPVETSRLAEILDMIIRVVGIGFVILVSLYVLYLILKRIPFFARKMKELGRKMMDLLLNLRKGRSLDEDSSYQDETESVFDMKQSMGQFVDRVKSRFTRGVNWENLNDKEKARELFRQVVEHAKKEGVTYRSYDTAQESITRIEKRLTADQALTTKFATVYDQARYSSLNIEQIDELKDELKQIGWIS